jgi:hypothetical protein
MPHYNTPYRGATPPSYPSGQYPGINQPDVGLEMKAQASSITPYSPQVYGSSFTPQSSVPNAGKSGGFSMPKINDIKGFIERMGGVEGIIATMGKVQKVMQTVQQFAPMAKILTGLLPGGSKSSAADDDSDYSEYKPRRRRKKTRKGAKSKKPVKRKKRTTPAKKKR